jgi:PAS domain S-box-containing protein
MHPTPMSKDICCENFKGLLAYIRSHYGDDGIRRLTAGLLDGPYFVRDNLAPDQIIPIGVEHLTNPAYWVSNAFSLILLGNVNRVVPGPNPLYTAGYGVVRENLSRTTLFAAKFAGIRRLAMRAAKINARFNRTKDVRPVDFTDTSLTFELNYRPGYDVTKDVCNWNLGIYSGIGSLTGVADVTARETACVLDGAPHCRFHITWRKRRLLSNGLRGLVAPLLGWAVKDLIAEHEKNSEEREALIEKLAVSENKYRTLFEDSLQAMSLSRQGKLVDVNPAWLKLHEYADKAEIIGKDVMEFIHPESREALKTRRANWSSKTERVTRMRDITRRGTTIDVEVFSSRITFDGAASVLATVRDITELKKSEDNRQQLEARLLRAEKMEAVATLAGGVAHDLNNILSGTVGYPDLILMQLPEDSVLVDPVRTIQDSGKKAAAIVQDLLTLARRGVTTREVINMNQVVHTYLESPEYHKMLSYHPGVEVVLALSPDLLNLSGSPVHLSKTMMNLVSNAAEAMPDGGRITIATENRYIDPHRKGFEEISEGEYCVLTVHDNGIGISKEDIAKIFEPFYTKKKMGRSGTGLGMAVVWGTVQDHAGFIRIRSEVGQGAVIRLYFPATREALTELAKPANIDQYQGHGEVILVVDDVPEQRAIASQMVTVMGYTVAVAASGEEALAYLEDNPCDLVLLDMIMDPGLDGLETYRRMIRRWPGQKAVIATGYSETDRVKEAQSIGAGVYLQKPYTFEKLGQAIRAELDRTVPPSYAGPDHLPGED